jgi:hypothetical protein
MLHDDGREGLTVRAEQHRSRTEQMARCYEAQKR